MTVHDYLKTVCAATSVALRTAEHYTACLRADGLFPHPSIGAGAWKTRVGPSDCTNLFLAVATQSFVQTGAAVRRLRAMQFVGAPDGAYLGLGDFGTVLDALIAGRSRDDAQPDAPCLFAPSVINVSASPDSGELIWLGRFGSVERRNVYGAELAPTAMVPRMRLTGALIELAAHACAPGTETPSQPPVRNRPRATEAAA